MINSNVIEQINPIQLNPKKKSLEPNGMANHQSWVMGAYLYLFGG